MFTYWQKGMIVLSIAIVCLILSIYVPLPDLLWGLTLGTSMVCNVVGTLFLMKHMKQTSKEGR